MPRLPNARIGDPLGKPRRGFPAFFHGKTRDRIITRDVWAYLRHATNSLGVRSKLRAQAFLNQAEDFYQAASNPRLSSRPLLYYYAFLNLAKVLLLQRGGSLPAKVGHGLFDPRANSKAIIAINNQVVEMKPWAANHSELFPDLVRTLAPSHAMKRRRFRIRRLLQEVPAIHRTFEATGGDGILLPVEKFELLSDGAEVWARMQLALDDRYANLRKQLLPRPAFRAVWTRVADAERVTLQSSAFEYRGAQLDGVIGRLADRIRQTGLRVLLTHGGYVNYFIAPHRPDSLPQLANAYAVMFYLGSITRYRPDEYQQLIDEHAWLVNEFMETQTVQFLYLMASELAGTEVVAPHAIATPP